MRRLFDGIIDHPLIVVLLTVTLTVALGWGTTRLTRDDSTDKMLPDRDPILQYTRRMEEIFASDEFIVVAVESEEPFSTATVAKLVRMTGELAVVPGVREVISPVTTKNVRGAAGMLFSEPLVDEQDPPDTPEELEAYRRAIGSKAIFRGSIISESGRAFGFVLRLERNPDKKALVEGVRKVVDRNQGPERIYFSGSPPINLQVVSYMGRDMARYFPLVLLLILGTLWFNFRSLRGVLLPLVAVIISVVWALGLQGWLGVPISVIGTMIPTLLIAVGVSYGIHVLNDYYRVAPGRTDRKEAVVDAMVSIAPTIALAGATTIFGFLSLVVNETPILREFGWITSAGILASMVVAMTFVPAVLALLNPPAAAPSEELAARPMARLLAGIARFNDRRRYLALGVGALLVLMSVAGYPRLFLETNAINFFKAEDPIRAVIGRISSEFGGTITIRTIIEAPQPGTILRAEYLKAMEDYQAFLAGFDRVGKTLSIADMIKDMNMALHEGDPAFNILGETHEGNEQLLFLYSLSAKPDEFESLIDGTHSVATVTARLRQVNDQNKPLGTRETEVILGKIQEYIAGHFPPGLKVTPTGRAQDIVRSSNYIVKGLIRSMATAILPIWLLASIIFRSPVAGLFGIATTAVGLLLNFGVMGWFGLPLDIASTIISSIAIGIGVDDAMHYLLRYRRNMALAGGDDSRAMAMTITEAGRAVIVTSMTMVLGFSIFMVASFRPVIYFGGLTALSMVTTSVAALLIVPVGLLLARPRFARRGLNRAAAPEGKA